MKPINCIVTGSGGYVGSYFVKRLRQETDWNIYEMGRNKQIPYELGQKNKLHDLNGIDVLIHCAYDFSLKRFQEIYEINVLGTLELFHHAKKAGVGTIIFISSMSAFQGTKSHYGKAKLLIEASCKDLGVIVLRPGLIFNKTARGIFGSINKYVRSLPIVPLIGNGNQLFYPCYLEDLFQLILFLIKNNYQSFPFPIIAASQCPVTFKKMVKIIAAVNQKQVLMLPLPYWILYASMKLLEKVNINMGLRSDSLIGAQYFDRSVHDFKFLEDNNIQFRALDEVSCSQ